MTWAKLDDAFPDHPKVASLSDSAFRLHVGAICYAARFLTDGRIPFAVLPRLGGTEATERELIAAGLWEEAEGGWEIHDYLDFNPSRATVDDGRRRKQAAGQAGGQASAQARATALPKQSPVPVPVPLEPLCAHPSGAVAAPHKRVKQEFHPLTDEQRKAIEAEFRTTPAVSEEIDRALAHEAAGKSTDMNLYVRGWLRRQRPPPVTSSKPNMMPEFRREPP